MHPDYVWAYAYNTGGVYFDKNRDIESSYEKHVYKQHWEISKKGPLYDGDVVSFRNKYYDNNALCYKKGHTPNVYCIKGLEDKWILEIVDAVDSPNQRL